MVRDVNVAAQERLDMRSGRFENGRIVERWGSSDELGILHQLGAVPERVVAD